ncbi:hypothetical protein [Tenacibaculum discolor]|uniref:hypothetical protein n=1 Tax=Tenacibaculum discolor TaxID=361581 RepID=UPI000EB5AD19|nr:hypothetical protein [Tenacibaculum discolor]RLK02159.1 hypothetical protein C8N27_1292 [Tenacibaculum discolor]
MAENDKKAIDSEIEKGEVKQHFQKGSESSTESKGPKIKRGRYDSLVLYEVSESELYIIERGSPSSTYLNFAIFSLSIGLSFLASLLTFDLDNQSDKAYIVFVVITVLGILLGLLLLIIWWRSKNQFDDVIKKIKSRTIE